MPQCLNETISPAILLQLADDAALAIYDDDDTRGLISLSMNFKNIFDYSDNKYLYVNFDKTFYIHISDNPISVPVPVEGYQSIMPAKDNQTIYLGMLFIQSTNINDHIDANLKHRAFNIKKFHDWMDVNGETPIIVKIRVLYGCMFPALIYGCETWFTIDNVTEKLLKIERSLLKRILGVRDSTPNDLIYIELGIPDIISKIKKRQVNYFRKTSSLNYEDSSIRYILDKCVDLPCYQYYLDINPNITQENIISRRHTIETSEQTYSTRYTTTVGFTRCEALYDDFLDESRRTVITRWRLSNHKLSIETETYKDTSK